MLTYDPNRPNPILNLSGSARELIARHAARWRSFNTYLTVEHKIRMLTGFAREASAHSPEAFAIYHQLLCNCASGVQDWPHLFNIFVDEWFTRHSEIKR